MYFVISCVICVWERDIVVLLRKTIDTYLLLRSITHCFKISRCPTVDNSEHVYIFKKAIISDIARRFKLEWTVKEIIRTKVKRFLQNSNIINAVHTVNATKTYEKSALEFLYDEISDNNNVYIQKETYITEPQ